jgi:hypothetical protein
MTETSPPARIRIRWGWFVACLVLGLAAIAAGALAAPSGARLDYLAGVLANVGTTLLLVGIVVLLERRIIDSAVRVVRNANRQANEALRAQIQEFEDRVAAEWASTTAENLAEKKATTERLTDEFTKKVVDDSTGLRRS